ncbi:flagellar biosynthesis protein FlhB [Neobacillus jeddahensis]|uniref:flagellar biosynthesis protein FlhB n=1 Tax=Neobacillus jeddahensis TaxID=1461580 RepID=UPI000944A965|nr:flagellar biosynthesis protein FlhB [Neobacillus jeddahensis]
MLLRLDLQLFSGEKTEKATPNKRREAKKKGQVVKSMEVSSALTLLLSFSFLMIGGKTLVEGCISIYRRSFQEYMLWDLTEANTRVLFNQLVFDAAKLVAPLLGIALIAGLVANFAQVGFMLNPLKFSFSKMNPLSGLKNMFSLRSLVELFKSLLKIILTGLIVFFVIWKKKEELLLIGQKSIFDSARFIGSLIIQIGLAAAACLAVIAAADYLYQKYEYEKKLKMSKQDIKDEYKKQEGDPHIKGQRRAKQREMSMNRMMQEVPKADVVITNPTHFAVAIRYDFNTMDSPIVIAKGQDHVALKIKEIAKEHKIMTVENRPVARALFAAVEIGEPIPEDMFNAVGEILAFVYFQEGRYKGMMS